MAQEKTRILFVDDEKHNLLAFKANFRREFDVLTAQSAREGKEIMERQENIQVVISDQRMPDETGVEFLEFVKKEHPQSVRMLLSAYTDAGALMDAINKAQVYSYMSKPFDRDAIMGSIENALSAPAPEATATQAPAQGYEGAELNDQHREELATLLDEYTGLWEAWVNRSTLLSAKEVLAVEYFRKHGDHNVLASELGVPKNSVYNTYTHAISKLKTNMSTLNAWIVARALELKQRENSPKGDAAQRFLRTPLKELSLSRPIVLALSLIDCYKSEDIVAKTSKAELLKLRNFGQKKLDELVALFEANDCGELLN